MDTTQLTQSLYWLAPSFALVIAGCLVLCGSLFNKKELPRDITERRNAYAAVSLFVIAAAFVWHWFRADAASEQILGLFVWDQSAVAAERLALLGGIILALIGWSIAPRAYLPEYFGCLLTIIGATSLVGACDDLMALFLVLELISIPTYVMLATVRGNNESLESAIKYFLLSAFSSAFFLLGCSYLYGVAGTTDLNVVVKSMAGSETNFIALLGLIFVMCGLTFRITAVPFHFYGPDVFEGTNISMAALMSYVPKVAGFMALLRLLSEIPAASFASNKLIPILMVIAILTMCIGNAMAAAQDNLRRLLGYSSIAHSGYILLGLIALMRGSADPAVIYAYLIAYAMMTLGLFAFLAEVEAAGGRNTLIGDLSGMFYRRQAASVAAVICLISLIGLPLTAGFWAKFQIFSSGIGVGGWDMIVCVIIMAINAAVAAGYYWKILAKIFDQSANLPPLPIWRPSLFLAYSICAVLTVIWFFVPSGM
jgi:NADH-quinone oxidoreductase subunit N